MANTTHRWGRPRMGLGVHFDDAILPTVGDLTFDLRSGLQHLDS